MATQPDVNDVLFFIPDIGGFTKFVAETEVRHSRHIVKELLEILVDANRLGLEVSEFEGDAVLFYRSGAPPSLGELVEQAHRMFVDFHSHLKQFEFTRICQCGACVGASRIALKFVAHYGSAGTMQVKDRVKFIGKDIIVAHRLLKNSVPESQYLLVTQPTLDRIDGSDAASFTSGADAYDELGDIAYRYRSLAGYLDEIKVQPPAPFRLANPLQVMRVACHIDAPAELVYQTAIDLPARMRWIDGIKSIEFRDDSPNRIGKVHRCVRGGNDPEVMTSDVRVSDTTMEFWETDVKKMGACRYLLTKAPDNTTDLALEFYVRGNIVVRLVFKLLMERKLKPAFERSIANLAAVCKRAG
jgi:hypothetical protein